jgi:flagellar basal-body rod modification protein FlgD
MAVNSISQATQSVNQGIGSLAQNYETFLHLLTTQLKNQDPLSPLDNNQFTQQLTQMTGVQQQLLTNQLLTQLLGQGQADIGSGAINLIGKMVTVESNDAALTEGMAEWKYTLPGEAAESKLTIVDANGKTVWTGELADNGKGEHSVVWDGRDLKGQQLPDGGIYTARFDAKDSNGAAMAVTAQVTGVASRIQTLDGQTMLTVGPIKAPLTAVTGVQTAPS